MRGGDFFFHSAANLPNDKLFVNSLFSLKSSKVLRLSAEKVHRRTSALKPSSDVPQGSSSIYKEGVAMSSLGKTGDARGVNAFVSGETSRIVDAFPEMAEWFEKEAAAERALPRVVGRLPDFGTRQPLARKSKRFKFGKFVKNALCLTLTFFLGAASAYRLNDVPKIASNGEEEAASPPRVSEKTVADSSDWPTLDSLASDVGTMFDPYDLDSSAASQPKGGALYSSLDDIAFTEPAPATSSFGGTWSSFAPDANQSPTIPGDAIAPSYPSSFNAQNEPLVADVDAPSNAPTPSFGGFEGFQGYEFNQSVVSEPYAEREEETPPTDMAENERDHFLANASPISNENDFNNNDEFINQTRNSQQIIATNSANLATSPQDFDYNSQNGYNGNQSTTARTATRRESAPAESRFASFGSSWNAPGDAADAVSSESPFLEDRFNGEYVARNFDDPVVETSAPTQRPARAIRW